MPQKQLPHRHNPAATQRPVSRKREIAKGERLIELMDRVEGKKSSSRLDDNYGHIFQAHVYVDGRYVCEAHAKPRYNRAKLEQTAADRKARAVMSAYVATIEAYGTSRRQSLDTVTVIDDSPKTLNNKFIVPGSKRKEEHVYEEREAETLSGWDELESNEPAWDGYEYRKTIPARGWNQIGPLP